jgi:hypothetical protein
VLPTDWNPSEAPGGAGRRLNPGRGPTLAPAAGRNPGEGPRVVLAGRNPGEGTTLAR